MKFLRWLNTTVPVLFGIAVILTFLSACSSTGFGGPIFPTETSLPQPIVNVTPAPNVDAALSAYLDAFKANDYNTMYAKLSKVSQDSISLEDFAKRNRDALNTMSASSFDYEVLSSLMGPYSSEVAFRIIYHTALVGDLQRDMVAHFALENNEWKLKWEDGLILPELAGGNVLQMDYEVPSRGNILIAADDTVYVSDVNTGSIAVVRNGQTVDTIPGLGRPHGISMDSDGTFYASDSTNRTVMKISTKK